MVTLQEVLKDYCTKKNIGEPTMNDIRDIGRIVSNHFRHFWATRQTLEDGMLPDCGFTVIIEDGRKVCVNAYPNAFMMDMVAGIQLYYTKKAENISTHAASLGVKKVRNVTRETSQVSHRKRIPYKPK